MAANRFAAVRITLTLAVALFLQVMADAGIGGAAAPALDWHEVKTPVGNPGFGFIDLSHGRVVRIRLGGEGNRNTDLWEMPITGTRTWRRVAVAGPAPPTTKGASAVLDEAGNRVLVFGGMVGLGGWTGPKYLDEVWALSLGEAPAWSRLEIYGDTPGGRQHASLVCDPVTRRLILFGGERNGKHDDCWALSLDGTPAWTRLASGGPRPPGRWGSAAAYDARRRRLVISGGLCPERKRTLFVSKETGGTEYLADTWALPLEGEATWQELKGGGPAPVASGFAAATFDSATDRVLLFGGVTKQGVTREARVLALGDEPVWSTWTPDATSPAGRSMAAAALDAGSRRMLLFGGTGDDVPSLTDLWSLALDGAPTWSVLEPAIATPGERFGHAMAYDPGEDRLLIFGGTDGWVPFSDLWARPCEDSSWQALGPRGTPPPGRMGGTLVYDPTPPRLVLFGGWGWKDDKQISYNDCWTLDLGDSPAWTRLDPGGNPPSAPRNHHSAIYDPVRDRMLIFGGGKREVWALSLGAAPAWTELATAGPEPPPLEAHSAVYDARHDRMLVFGGAAGNYSPLMKLTGGPPTKTSADVWALSLAETPTWSKLDVTGEPPSPRYQHVAVMDSLSDRMLIFAGGHSRGGPQADAWALTLSGEPTWTKLETGPVSPEPRMSSAAAMDARGRLWLYGGARYGGFGGLAGGTEDLWWVALHGGSGVERQESAR